MQKHSLGEVGK